jgi:hypothetical protein
MTYTYRIISDLKNRARKIAREEALPHNKALDEAARRGGFENYTHALNCLPERVEARQYSIEIRQFWRNPAEQQSGIASGFVALDTPLPQLVRPHQLVGALGGCTIDGGNRLISNTFMRDSKGSQADVGRLARTLQFINATGLKPSRARSCYPGREWSNRPPIADHDTCWFDPEARAHVLVTEPYPDRALRRAENQTAWEKLHGWSVVPTQWGSMYGYGTDLILVCSNSYRNVLKRKIALLERSRSAIQIEAISIGTEHRYSPIS